MNVSVGQLINDAKDLVTRLKERETNLDQVVVQSNALAKRVDAIQQVYPPPPRIHLVLILTSFTLPLITRFNNLLFFKLENEFIKFNEKANHKSKATVLSNIQKENRVIK